MYTVDSDLKDQDDLFEDVPLGTSTLNRYHRTSNARASTYFAGAAAAMRFGSNLAFGFGLNYFSIDELVQNYQDVKVTNANLVQSNTVATRESLTAYGIEPTFGVQIALPKNFAVGLVIKKGFFLSQHYERADEVHESTTAAANQENLDAGEKVTGQFSVRQSQANTDSKDPLGDWPLSTRLGVAWFTSTKLMLSTDISYTGAVKPTERLGYPENIIPYQKEAVTNFAAGAEYYVLPSFPLRLGVFSNNDARPKIDKAKTGQSDHIDYIGETLFIAWVQPNSQIAAGFVLQQGTGEAQKLQDTLAVQKITGEANTFAFSATHNF